MTLVSRAISDNIMNSVKTTGEFKLIERIREILPCHNPPSVLLGLGDDTAKLYINPPGIDEPETPVLETIGEFSFNELRINRLGYNGTVSRWDEISVATNFASAVIGNIQ